MSKAIVAWSRSIVCAGLVLAPSVGLMSCDAGEAPGQKVAVAIAPLTLPGVTNACFTLSVHNGPPAAGGQLVWTKAAICADDYGDGSGSVTYIGTCDASVPNDNVVSLVLEDLYSGTPPAPLSGEGFQNPCPADRPCLRSVTCEENADAEVVFDITVLRDANQGFFDIAVNFADIFCSAKFDCVDAAGDPLELLHDPATGERAPTGVLGFACTSGAGETTWLHLDDIVITCDAGTPGATTTNVDPHPAVCNDGATFTDGTFGGPGWDDGYIAGGLEPGANNATVVTAAAGGSGNPAPYLEMQITNRGNSRIHTYALFPTATWNPATQGAITDIAVSYDIRLRTITGTFLASGETGPVQPSQGGNAQFAIMQGGVVYAPSLGAVCPAETNCDTWRTRSMSWVVATQIGTLSNAIRANGDPVAPTLNLVDGGPVTFGVLVGLTGGNPNYDFHYTYEVDNFALTLGVDCIEPLPGNAGPELPGTFQTAVYWGREQFEGLDKCYWNVALGWNFADGGLGKNCVLETRGTASPAAFPGGATPADSTWPFIHWRIDVTDDNGDLACGAHGLNVTGSGVDTEYTEGTRETFDASRECAPAAD